MLSTIPLAQDNLKTDSGFVVRKKNLYCPTTYDGIQSHKLPGLHRQRACPKAEHFMAPSHPTGSLFP